jgi:hypothetical protein
MPLMTFGVGGGLGVGPGTGIGCGCTVGACEGALVVGIAPLQDVKPTKDIPESKPEQFAEDCEFLWLVFKC